MRQKSIELVILMNVILLNFLGWYKFNDGKYNKFFGFFY